MKFLSFRTPAGDESVGVLVEDRVIDLATVLEPGGVGRSPLRRLIEQHSGVLPTAADAFSNLQSYALASVEVLPVVPDPSKIVAAPVNYFDHKAEMNEDAHIDALGVFLKAPSSVLADGGTVTLPYTDRRFDQEGELACVIGRTARHVSAENALQHVAGYTCLLDMTMRGGEDRSTRKSFETFTPVGPHLVTPDEVGDLDTLRLRTWVGGDLRQDADIKDLIWGVPELVSYVSSVMTLNPGDIVSTGTPAGVGEVNDGDVITVEITGLGRLSANVNSAGAVACPTRGASRGPTPPTTVTPVRSRRG